MAYSELANWNGGNDNDNGPGIRIGAGEGHRQQQKSIQHSNSSSHSHSHSNVARLPGSMNIITYKTCVQSTPLLSFLTAYYEDHRHAWL